MERPEAKDKAINEYIDSLENTIVGQARHIEELVAVIKAYDQLVEDDIDAQAQCPKCAGVDMAKKWQPADMLTMAGLLPERIEYTCDDCGFSWIVELGASNDSNGTAKKD